MPLDYTYRIQLPHRPGQLAKVAGAIAEGEGLIGDVVTINVGREHSIREITIEVEDHDQGAEWINPEMKLAAADALAELAAEAELVPDALDPSVHERVALAVQDAAIESGVAHLERVPAGL